jgi:hypothetical protein
MNVENVEFDNKIKNLLNVYETFQKSKPTRTTSTVTCRIQMPSARLGEFISLNRQFEQDLIILKELSINYLRRGSAKRPMNIYLNALPGSGKSYLIKELVKSVSKELKSTNVVYEEFNISSMDKIENVENIFNYIQSSNIAQETPFILIDECDVLLNDRNIYQKFLMPMYDGVFIRDGRSAKLGRAVLFFASSIKLLKDLSVKDIKLKYDNLDYGVYVSEMEDAFDQLKNSDDKNESDLKLPDFLDRIDKYIFIPPFYVHFKDYEIEKENYLIALQIIKKHFDSVTRVSVAALIIVCFFLMEHGKRKADKIVFLSKNPRGSTFEIENLPIDIQRKIVGYINPVKNHYFILPKR